VTNSTIVRITTPADVRLRLAHPTDRVRVAGLLAGLSAESAYARFQTGMAQPSRRVLDALLVEPPRGRAVLAFAGAELVGHGLCLRLDPTTAELALVVADRFHRHGVGTRLARALTEDLLAHGVTDVEVFATTANRAVARMVATAAPGARRELDGPTSTWSFPVRPATVSRTA
jgi:GNAT superfamily N-acetyltransferase